MQILKVRRLSHLRKANQVEADHVIKRLTELAPSALLGEQHFFIGWGLHRLQKLSNIVAIDSKDIVFYIRYFLTIAIISLSPIFNFQEVYGPQICDRPHLPFLFPEKFGDFYPNMWQICDKYVTNIPGGLLWQSGWCDWLHRCIYQESCSLPHRQSSLLKNNIR